MTPRRILIGGWLLFILYAYPGYMLTESANMLVDSRTTDYTDWHSAMMTWLWRIVGIVISGPAGMLVVQSVLLLVGSYRLFTRAMTEKTAAIAAVCVLVFPPVMATSAVICPEALLASFLVAAAAGLTSEQFRWRCVGLGLAALAAGIHDGGALPVLVLVITLFTWRHPLAGWRRFAASAVAAIVAVGFGVGLDRALPNERSERNEIALAMSDIVGTLEYAAPQTDESLHALLAGVPIAQPEGIQARAHKLYGKLFAYARGDDRLFDPMTTDSERHALYDARRALVMRSPGAYLQHRWRSFSRVLGLRRTSSWSPVYTRHYERVEDVMATHQLARTSLAQGVLVSIVRVAKNTFFFRPYFYLLLAIPLWIFALAKKRRHASILLGTGLAYVLTLLFVANRYEYRGGHTLIVFTVLGAIALAASQARDKRVGDKTAIRRADDDDVHAGERRT